MFEMTDIVKSYGDKKVLDGVSIRAERGKPVCLFGPSGCGKTTLLNIAAGILKADSGTITKQGDRVSYVFQEDRLLPHSTARENIMLSARNKELAEKIIEAAELEEFLDTYPDSMSGGMKKRTAIARAVAFDGDIFLLDEPFNGIDEKRKIKICECIKEAVKNKICIIVSHDRRDAELLDAELKFLNNC